MSQNIYQTIGLSDANIDQWKLIFLNYYELCKPNVVALMLLTSLIGMLLASEGWVSLWLIFWTNLGIGLCASGAAAVNHIVDRHIDQRMARTFNRPIAKGRVQPLHAAIFAMVMSILGTAILFTFVNPLTAWLTLFSLLGYAVVYTLFLKRTTPQNIVIGGLAGAAPPLLGWTAVTNSMGGYGLLLVLIIFAWTPPHFWALAVHRKDDYAQAKIPMLPVTHGVAYTKLHIMLYTLILCAVTLLPFATGMLSWIYLAGALILNAGFFYYAALMLLSTKPGLGYATFKYSIIYLMALFVVMLADHYIL